VVCNTKNSKAVTACVNGSVHLKMAISRGRNMQCKKCTIKRAPTSVAYGGFYIRGILVDLTGYIKSKEKNIIS
jgi:hypothetical protein